MTAPTKNSISSATAWKAALSSWLACFTIYTIEYIASDYLKGANVTAKLFAAVVLTSSIFFSFGCSLTAWIVFLRAIACDWRSFIRTSIDIGLVPIVIPSLLVAGLIIGAWPVSYFATPWWGELFAILLGLEFGGFVVVIAVPYIPFVWPLFNRFTRCSSHDGFAFAAKTWKIMGVFAVYSIAILPLGPPVWLWLIVCASWLSFGWAHERLFLPRFPRYTLADRDSRQSANMG